MDVPKHCKAIGAAQKRYASINALCFRESVVDFLLKSNLIGQNDTRPIPKMQPLGARVCFHA